MSLQENKHFAPATYFVCERCSGLAMLTSIEPHPLYGTRSEVHTFECLQCGHREAFSRKIPR
jgi:hypothetical protein